MVKDKVDDQGSRYALSKRALELLNKLLEYERRSGKNPLYIVTEKTAAQIVAEGRE